MATALPPAEGTMPELERSGQFRLVPEAREAAMGLLFASHISPPAGHVSVDLPGRGGDVWVVHLPVGVVEPAKLGGVPLAPAAESAEVASLKATIALIREGVNAIASRPGMSFVAALRMALHPDPAQVAEYARRLQDGSS